jgi:hypothetical protein
MVAICQPIQQRFIAILANTNLVHLAMSDQEKPIGCLT